jgi:hypothetical protein
VCESAGLRKALPTRLRKTAATRWLRKRNQFARYPELVRALVSGNDPNLPWLFQDFQQQGKGGCRRKILGANLPESIVRLSYAPSYRFPSFRFFDCVAFYRVFQLVASRARTESKLGTQSKKPHKVSVSPRRRAWSHVADFSRIILALNSQTCDFRCPRLIGTDVVDKLQPPSSFSGRLLPWLKSVSKISVRLPACQTSTSGRHRRNPFLRRSGQRER